MVSEDGLTDLIPAISGWRGSAVVQVESEFRPLGAPVGEVDGSIVVQGQLDRSLGEKQHVGDVIGSVIKNTLPGERNRGYRPGM